VVALQGGYLTEDGLDDRLASGVNGLARCGAELAGHPLLERVVVRDPAARCGFDDLVVTEATGGDQELRAVLCGELRGGFQVRLRAVAGVGQRLLRGPNGVAAGLGHHRGEGLAVRGAVVQVAMIT